MILLATESGESAAGSTIIEIQIVASMLTYSKPPYPKPASQVTQDRDAGASFVSWWGKLANLDRADDLRIYSRYHASKHRTQSPQAPVTQDRDAGTSFVKGVGEA